LDCLKRAKRIDPEIIQHVRFADPRHRLQRDRARRIAKPRKRPAALLRSSSNSLRNRP
jgi:hypothetical protein